MKSFFKGLLTTLIVVLLLGAIAVALLFTLVNSFKFMTYSSKKMDKVYSALNTDDIRFIAHRGLSKEEFQNTAPAFRLAAADPDVWGIETDIWVTSDGRFVCMHDAESLEGVDNIRNVTFEEAIATPLEKNDKEEEQYPGVSYAPSLEEYLDICKEGGKVAVIELKDRLMSEEEIDRVLNLVAAKGVDANFGSFHFEKLKYIRSKNSEIGLHLFTLIGLPRDMADAGFTSNDKMKAVIEQRINISCYYRYLSKSLAKMFHDAGLEVGVWTVNDTKMAACLYYEYGIDYLTTDVRQSDLF